MPGPCGKENKWLKENGNCNDIVSEESRKKSVFDESQSRYIPCVLGLPEKKMYFDELKKSMNFLGSQKNTIFIGQAVEVPGTAMSNTLKDVNKIKKLELPVTEEMQMGITIGLLMNGYIPVSIFPRWNFMLLAINQLVNHLDKLHIMNGKNKYKSNQSCLDDDTYYNIRLNLHSYKSVSIHPGNCSFIISYLCNLQNGN